MQHIFLIYKIKTPNLAYALMNKCSLILNIDHDLEYFEVRMNFVNMSD